jgi:hypothetical protein
MSQAVTVIPQDREAELDLLLGNMLTDRSAYIDIVEEDRKLDPLAAIIIWSVAMAIFDAVTFAVLFSVLR